MVNLSPEPSDFAIYEESVVGLRATEMPLLLVEKAKFVIGIPAAMIYPLSEIVDVPLYVVSRAAL